MPECHRDVRGQQHHHEGVRVPSGPTKGATVGKAVWSLVNRYAEVSTFFLVIYLLQLDEVNSPLLTVAPFVGPDGTRTPSW